ncbi:MAG: oligosaccharide flippase family protein, partial [Prevotella sp.]|nr:oligosaccharide flippase family protein [Prevotella sp.]
MSQTSLKERTAKGLFWGAMNSGTTQVLNLVIGIFLARLLSPADYGIVGVLTIFTAIAGDLQSAGFTQALVNIRRPEDRHYNSVFSFNVVMSVIMYALLFFCAPLIASFFHQPCLVSVSRVVFLSFLISSLGIAHGGFMTKNMMNKEIAIIGALALIVSGSVGITLALLG